MIKHPPFASGSTYLYCLCLISRAMLTFFFIFSRQPQPFASNFAYYTINVTKFVIRAGIFCFFTKFYLFFFYTVVSLLFSFNQILFKES